MMNDKHGQNEPSKNGGGCEKKEKKKKWKRVFPKGEERVNGTKRKQSEIRGHGVKTGENRNAEKKKRRKNTI